MLYSERFVIYNLKSLKLSRRSIKAEFRHRMNNSELNFSNLLAQYSDIREMPTDNVPEQNDWYSFFWNNEKEFLQIISREYTYVLSVHQWVGVSDPFQEGVTTWREVLRNLFLKKRFFLNERHEVLFFDKIVGGYQILSIEDANFLFPFSAWLRRAMNPDCPFVGKLLGFLLLNIIYHADKLFSVALRVCRGYVACLESPTRVLCSITMVPMRVGFGKEKRCVEDDEEDDDIDDSKSSSENKFWVDKNHCPSVYLLSKSQFSQYAQQLQKVGGKTWDAGRLKSITFWAIDSNYVLEYLYGTPTRFDALIDKLLKAQEQQQLRNNKTNTNT
jgi:hypothetical protein